MIPASALDEAVTRGIITAGQREAILALGVQRASVNTITEAAAPEAPRGFNGVTVAYAVGAIAVLFAFGWFLFERWSTLGALGVLLVSAGYAVLFVVAARLLERQGFHTASSIATLLAVAMTPVLTWAVLALTGLWHERPPGGTWPDSGEATRWLPIELATIVVASVVIWRARIGLLTLPIAVAAGFGALHLLRLFVEPSIAFRVERWMALFVGSVLLLVGYAADQRSGREDYAQWFYVVGLLAVALGLAELWAGMRSAAPHIIALLSVGAVVVSLYLRRRAFLVFGAAGAISYLAYLAFDVFRRTLGFSIVLAGFGITVIALTVWLQRRYPAFARQVAAQQGDARPSLPGGYALFGVGTALTLVLLLTAPPRARREQRAVDELVRRTTPPAPPSRDSVRR
jgi:hypothetical protein